MAKFIKVREFKDKGLCYYVNIESIDAFREAPDGGTLFLHGREIDIPRDMMEQIKRLITRKLWPRLKK